MTEKQAAMRERILDAALRTMADVGFEGASTRAIAARAGLPHELMRYYFRTKEALWFAVVGDLMTRFREDLAAALQPVDSADPVAVLRVVIDQMVSFHITAPGFHRITLLESTQNSPRLEWLMQTHFQPLYDFLTLQIERGQAIGKVRPLDPMRLAYGIPTLVGGYCMAAHQLQILGHRDVLSPEETDQTAAFVRAFVFEDGV